MEERLGQQIPVDLAFIDEQGERVCLKDIIERPTIISMVYFSCGQTCPLLLGGLAESLRGMKLAPMRDYQVLTISFDEKDTPLLARQKKKNYLPAAGESFPAASWRFLTGDAESIRRLTEALGFTFRKEKGGFSHPKALFFLSRTGRIMRYLYGTSFRPFDVRMALAEAAREEGFGSGNLLLFSYSYDDSERKYVFNLPKAFGSFFLFTIGAIILGVTAVRHVRRGKR